MNAARRSKRLLVQAARNFLSDGGFNHAAAVAYYSILSLAPFLYLLSRLVEALLPGEGSVESTLSPLFGIVPEEAAPILNSVGEEIRAGKGLVAVALPALLWVASAAFLSLEVAVNVAFDTLRERRFWLSRLKAFVSAACAAWLLAASALLPQVTDWLDRYRVRLGLPSFLGPGAAWVGSVLLAIVTFLVFAWLYKILPRGKVGLRHASIAAAMALVLWEAARRLFSAVLVHSTAFGLLTGTVAGVAAFLLWVFLANSILLYGAEMAALLNGNRWIRTGA